MRCTGVLLTCWADRKRMKPRLRAMRMLMIGPAKHAVIAMLLKPLRNECHLSTKDLDYPDFASLRVYSLVPAGQKSHQKVWTAHASQVRSRDLQLH